MDDMKEGEVRMTGREIREKLKEMPSTALYGFLRETVKQASDVIAKMPENRDSSSLMLLVLGLEELTKRFSEYVKAEMMANEVVEELKNLMLAASTAAVPPDKAN